MVRKKKKLRRFSQSFRFPRLKSGLTAYTSIFYNRIHEYLVLPNLERLNSFDAPKHGAVHSTFSAHIQTTYQSAVSVLS